MMGVLWFSVFIILGLIMRKLKFPIRFSVIPLLLLLVLSVLRMFIAVEVPGSVIILSETVYPAIVNFLRYEIISHRIFGLPINAISVFVFVWIAGTVFLTSRYANQNIGRFRPVINWLGRSVRDEYAESLLSEIIGSDKNFRVYRNGCFVTAGATAFKPYIILPEVDFPPDELRVILLHEWKHIQDKDYLTGIIVNLISFLFWWNPMVYVLKQNFRFATELKCEQFAVSNKQDFHHFLDGLLLLDDLEKGKINKAMERGAVNSFISDGDGLSDRLKVLALRKESPHRQMFTNVCYSVFIFTAFIASYMLTILPAFWESPDVPVSIENFNWEESEHLDIFRVEENFLVDNGDGTFSFYIDGQFVMYIDNTHDIFSVLPILARDSD